jgi:hypothetical protein
MATELISLAMSVAPQRTLAHVYAHNQKHARQDNQR